MKFKNVLLLALISLSIQSFAQSKPELSKKIDLLAKDIIQYVHSEDVFMKTGKSLIGTSDYKALKKIVMNNGFPTISMVGKESSHKFWMMVQLCDFDLQMQMVVLKQMGRLVRKGEVIKEDYAMLTDRTRMNRNLPQLYGTQYVLDHDGEVMVYQIQDMDNVNDRRKSMDMERLDDSKKTVINTMAKKNTSENSNFDDRPNKY